MLRPFFPELVMSTDLLNFEHPSVLLFFFKRKWFYVWYQTIWRFPFTNVTWHSVTRHYKMTTPHWSDFVPNSTFYRFLGGLHRTFATGVTCRQGTFTPPDTWSRPFGTGICSTCWDPSFFRTCRYFYGLCSSNIPRYFLDFALWCHIS